MRRARSATTGRADAGTSIGAPSARILARTAVGSSELLQVSTERSTIGILKGSAMCARLAEVRQPFSSSVERSCDMPTHSVMPADRGQPSSALGARRSSGAGQSSLLVGWCLRGRG